MGDLVELADSQDSLEEEIPDEEDKDRDIRSDKLDAREDTALADQSQDGACKHVVALQMLEEFLDDPDSAARSSSPSVASALMMIEPAREPGAGDRCSSDSAEEQETRSLPVVEAWPVAPSATASFARSPAASFSATAQAAAGSSSSLTASRLSVVAELLVAASRLRLDLIKQPVRKDEALLELLVVVVEDAWAHQIDLENQDEL